LGVAGNSDTGSKVFLLAAASTSCEGFLDALAFVLFGSSDLSFFFFDIISIRWQ
jgi:hypothetical protein